MNNIIFALSFLIVVPAAVGVVRFRLLPPPARYFTAMLILGLVAEIVAYGFAKLLGNNMPVYYFYFAALAIIHGLYFDSIYSDKIAKPLFFAVSLLPIIEFATLNHYQFGNYSTVVFTIVTIIYLLFAFYRIATNQVGDETYWLNGLLLLYFMGSLLFFFASRYLQGMNDMDSLKIMVGTRCFLNTTCYAGYSITLWKLSKSF